MSDEPYVVGIRFQKVGKVYHFDASNYRDLTKGDFVIVETLRGRQLGQVIQVLEDPVVPPEGPWKPVVGRATPQDLILRRMWQQKEAEAVVNCRAAAAQFRIVDVKFVACEFSFDGSRLSFLYSNESGEKQELKELRKSMQRLYPQTQIEFHMVGPRDVAKMLGGLGACGLANRCCSMFLTDFSPISIKMAKEQGISLTPTEITGMCGRLRCCLVYEYEQYVEARKQLPKRGKRVVTPMGEGKVMDVLPLKGSVMVEFEPGVLHEFIREDLQPADELEALRQKAEAPCERCPEAEKVVLGAPEGQEKVEGESLQASAIAPAPKTSGQPARREGRPHFKARKPPFSSAAQAQKGGAGPSQAFQKPNQPAGREANRQDRGRKEIDRKSELQPGKGNVEAARQDQDQAVKAVNRPPRKNRNNFARKGKKKSSGNTTEGA